MRNEHRQPEQSPVRPVLNAIIGGFAASVLSVIIFGWFGKEIPTPLTHLLDVTLGSIGTFLVQARNASGQRAADHLPTVPAATPGGEAVATVDVPPAGDVGG